MKLPNGYGSVYKIPGKRRRPWVAKKTLGWKVDEEKHKNIQIQKAIGYYATRQEALTALAHYNENPYDLDRDTITFSEVYRKWSEEHFKTIVPSAQRTLVSAYNYCTELHHMRMKAIRTIHLEETIAHADVGSATKGRMKSLFNLMYKYALKHDIVEKDYAALCNTVKRGKAAVPHIPFTQEEISLLWESVTFPFVDMVLIGIYSGWRPQELAVLKTADVDLSNKTYRGGLKTEAGQNRIVPIHPLVFDLVQNAYTYALSIHSDHLFNDPNSQTGPHLTYDKYRGRWKKIMNRFHLDHRPHDTRHTFVTKAKKAHMDEYLLKIIIGHSIQDITESVYTHRTLEDLREAIRLIQE